MNLQKNRAFSFFFHLKGWRRLFFSKKHTVEEFSIFDEFNAKEIIKLLDESERERVIFNEGSPDLRFQALMLKVPPYLRWASATEKEQIFQRLIGLQYRLEAQNKGIDPQDVDNEQLNGLKKLAVTWKRENPLLGAPVLSSRDLETLEEAARYPSFTRLVLEFPSVRELFFIWSLRDGNSALPFIEFPGAASRFIEQKISPRLGQFSTTQLVIEKKEHKGQIVKDLMMLFEGKHLSILDPEKVVEFRGGYELKLDDVWDIFGKKEWEVGNLEIFSSGIENWNIHHLGYWNQEEEAYRKIELNEDFWWRQLPLYLKLNRKQLIQRYKLNIKQGEWVAAAVATRGRYTLDFEETHAFLEVAIPEGDEYAIYDFGKLAFVYPKSAWDRVHMLTKTVHATVAYPDENVYYTHRQKGFFPLCLSASQGQTLMNSIREDIITSRQKNLVYQIESENCAKWVYSALVQAVGFQRVPDLFRMSLLDTEPVGVVAWIFRGIKKLPAAWQVPVLTYLHLPLGASRKIWVEEEGKKVPKSLVMHPFFKTGQVFLPALLVAKVASVSNFVNLKKFWKKYVNKLR